MSETTLVSCRKQVGGPASASVSARTGLQQRASAVAGWTTDLVADELGRDLVDARHALRVLRRQRRHDRHAVRRQGGEGLQVGLCRATPAAAISELPARMGRKPRGRELEDGELDGPGCRRRPRGPSLRSSGSRASEPWSSFQGRLALAGGRGRTGRGAVVLLGVGGASCRAAAGRAGRHGVPSSAPAWAELPSPPSPASDIATKQDRSCTSR